MYRARAGKPFSFLVGIVSVMRAGPLITVDYLGRLQMVTFVACTLGDDTAILVNMDQVRTLVRDNRTGMTQVNFNLDHVIAVKENTTAIQERIAAMR